MHTDLFLPQMIIIIIFKGQHSILTKQTFPTHLKQWHWQALRQQLETSSNIC